MGFQQIPNPTAAPPAAFTPSPSVPVGLTLQNTYTTSQSGLTFPVEWLYVVAVGGGGTGNAPGTSGPAGGGGAGACVQGWVRASEVTSVTIGAGAASAPAGSNNALSVGGATIVGPIRAPGGGGAFSNIQNIIGYVGAPEAGAGMGGAAGTSTYGPYPDVLGPGGVAYGLFAGARATMGSTKPAIATSGAGGSGTGAGGDGYEGPAGGGAWASAGGNCTSPTGATYTGGAGVTCGGGGAGILGNGAAGSGTGGGAGGLGGGGGGGGNNTAPTGAGGNGAVLIYY